MTLFLLTLAGFVSTLVGLVYAAIGLHRQKVEHRAGPIWKLTHNVVTWTRRQVLRQKPKVIFASGSATLGMITATIRGTGEVPLPDAATVDERIEQLSRRMDNVERQATTDRSRHTDDVKAVRTEIADVNENLRAAEGTFRADIANVAVGNIRLEATGLLWIAFGSFLMGVAAVIQAANTL